jgi:hypothetical protein
MKENKILEEIHPVRAEHGRECNYDVDVIFAEMREDLKRLQAEGWKVVSPAPRGKKLPTCCAMNRPSRSSRKLSLNTSPPVDNLHRHFSAR